ncbi:MAG: GntR family transcriptional regulator [Kiritimatiellae bacterium]|nr:GntR family transcriptional regulator [Kiritimatiellia bacterium]
MKKYESIYRAFRDRIVRNGFAPEGRLPSESEIGAEFGVSVATVRKAMDGLVAEGLIVRRQGNGTFVADPAVPVPSAHGIGRPMIMFIALSVTDFYCEELVLMQNAFSKLGYACMQCAAPDFGSPDGLRRIEQAVGLRDLAGIACGPVWHNYAAIAPLFESVRLPVVFVHPREPLPGNFVTTDSAAGTYQALCHLRDIGCASLRYFGPEEPDQVWSKTRGIRRFLSECMPEMPFGNLVVNLEDTLEGGHRALLKELKGGVAMDGVLASGDLSAVGLIGALRERGLSIPGNVAVIGSGRGSIAATTVPPLTMMELDTRQIAKEAVRVLHESILSGRNGARQQVVLQPRLVPRASTMGASGARRARKTDFKSGRLVGQS